MILDESALEKLSALDLTDEDYVVTCNGSPVTLWRDDLFRPEGAVNFKWCGAYSYIDKDNPTPALLELIASLP